MNGAGNDFIILDGIREKINTEDVPRIAAVLCERHLSIGADGLMLVLPAASDREDYRMLFYNSDGSMGEMCGNGARCICRYGFDTGLAGEIQRVGTTAGLVTGQRIDAGRYRVRLNDPAGLRMEENLTVDGKPYVCSYVELGDPGVPHAVLELPAEFRQAVGTLLKAPEKIAQKDREFLAELRELGRKLRYHSAFPKGANVDFYTVTGEDCLEMITYERGVEEFTYACGTGAGSVVYVLSRKNRTGRNGVRVLNRGGLLSIDVTEDGLYLTGPTNVVAKGEVTDAALTGTDS